ncbi:MAG: MerR family transcriptional regulator [Dehalococcoidia bacterium]|nr:MerR family transcriptional regulator [Dehalococcoidia bacterium]
MPAEPHIPTIKVAEPAAGRRRRATKAAEGVYVISVAARLLEMHPQTLRKYERAGLVSPSRTDGLLRLYSEQDIARLRMVKHLVDHWGMNLAGVEVTITLMDDMFIMQQRLQPFMDSNDEMLTVFRQVWNEMLDSLQLPGMAGHATDRNVTVLQGEDENEPTGRKGTRRS